MFLVNMFIVYAYRSCMFMCTYASRSQKRVSDALLYFSQSYSIGKGRLNETCTQWVFCCCFVLPRLAAKTFQWSYCFCRQEFQGPGRRLSIIGFLCVCWGSKIRPLSLLNKYAYWLNQFFSVYGTFNALFIYAGFDNYDCFW